MKNIFIQEKLIRRLTFNPGLVLTGYRTTRPISLVCVRGSGTILIHAERLQISDAPQKQNESV